MAYTGSGDSSLSAGEVMVAVAYCVLLLAMVSGILHQLWRRPVSARWRPFLETAMRAMKVISEGNADEISRIVEAKSQEMKVQHTLLFFQGGVVLYLPFLGFTVYNILSGVPKLFTLQQDVVFLSMYALSGISLLRADLFTSTTIDIFYGGNLLGGSLLLAPWFSAASSVSSVGALVVGVSLGVTLLNMARRPPLKVGCLNLLVIVSLTLKVIFDYVHLTGLEKARLLGLHSMTSFVAPLVISCSLEVSIQASLRYGLEMRGTKEVLSVADALLRSCCDVVIEIDLQGVVLSEALDLGGFLMMEPSRSLKNSRLTDYMPHEADRTNFMRSLGHLEESGGMGLAEAINVRMRDADNNSLRVELLSFRFRHLSGELRSLVGLREFSDTSTRHPSTSQRVSGGIRSDAGLGAVDTQAHTDPSGGDLDLSTSRTDSFSVNSAVTHAAIALVDCSRTSLPVRGYSSSFRLHFGRLAPGTCLADLVEDRDSFVRWAQSAASANTAGEAWPDSSVVFNLRQGRLQAMCRLLRDPDGDDENDLENEQLFFYDIRGGRRDVSTRSQSSRGSGSRSSSATSRGTPCLHMTL